MYGDSIYYIIFFNGVEFDCLSIQLLGLVLLVWSPHPSCSLIHATAFFSEGLSACLTSLLPAYLSFSSSFTKETKYLILGSGDLFLLVNIAYLAHL